MDLARAIATGRLVRTIGFDDGPFRRQTGGRAPLYGVVCAGTRLEGLVHGHVRQDGWNAGPEIARLLEGGKFLAQLHAVLLDGVAFAGLNVVDLPWLAARLDRPCLALMRQPPDLPAILAIAERLPRPLERKRRLLAAGPIHEAGTRQDAPENVLGTLYFQVAGASPEVARQLLRLVTDRGHVPEPLRLAHLLAGALAYGQSGRRA